ncbi:MULTISPECIES: DUF305 domain-containing protein [Streptomyces]|uniref:DUF305 domain-containing protein n=1 Tax=Streptomyces glycanivorans TaxID=3033808 RepID=A0ABY9JLM7_9ACTN|nr:MULTISPECIES: DUF305 domain-containing protein [unclassified Streptomyces]WLQ66912.1 DUF305 domain-containing protein [Streptomyces sp. Alt3]WSR51067.1 DUF305 domain-containing protein [Streptomyces sp. NBC_01201]
MSAALTRRTRWAVGSAVAVALLFAGAATVASARGDGAASAPLTPAADSADAGFARDMAVHHQQAVEMSFLVRDTTDDEDVRRLAYDIANTQANQRGMLLGWLDLWELPKTAPEGQGPMAWMADAHGGHSGHSGHDMQDMKGMEGMDHDGALMPGMATRTELERLRKARGKQAEILFLQLMTDHHKGGVAMARGCAEQCAVAVEGRLARGMVEAQQSELDLMADMLTARGAAPRP